MAAGVQKSWSATASSNANSDSNINFAEGQAPSTVNDSARALMAGVKAFANQITGAKTTGGSANAYTFTSDSAGVISTAYGAGMAFAFKANHTNTGAATLNVDGVGAVAIKKGGAQAALVANDIVSGGIYLVMYEVTGTCFVLLNPEAGVDTAFRIGQESGHRLTGTTALAVTTADVTSISTLYSTPDKHGVIPLYDGASWAAIVQAELSMALDSDSGHTGYHQSGKLFDVFYFDDSGTKRIGTGPAWTNDTTRSSGVTRLNGVYVNTSSMTVRFGSASGNTVTLAANRGTYLGTIYCTANGQTEDSAAKRMVWNAYNRRPRSMRVIEGTDTWNYSTASYRQANNSTANQLAMVRGLDEDEVFAQVVARVVHSAAAYVSLSVGIGLGSSTVNSATTFRRASTNDGSAGPLGMPTAEYVGFPGLGYRDLRWLEIGAGSGTQTWVGDAGGSDQCGMLGRVMA